MIVALDLSTSIIGLAARSAAGLELQAIRCIDEKDMSLRRTVKERLWPALDRLHARDAITLLAVEVAPPTFQDDETGRAKVQAVVGLQLGRALMMGELWAYVNDVPLRFVPNGEWRRWARDWAHTLPDPNKPKAPAKGRPALWANAPTSQPPRRAPGGGFTISFTGCAHTWFAKDLYALQDRPERCPTCSPSASAANDAADPMAHKALWVDLARRAWPEEVEAVAASARARAKDPTRPLHQLAGVADACDAALLLQYAITNPEES